jgi:hypothetical protein
MNYLLKPTILCTNGNTSHLGIESNQEMYSRVNLNHKTVNRRK